MRLSEMMRLRHLPISPEWSCCQRRLFGGTGSKIPRGLTIRRERTGSRRLRYLRESRGASMGQGLFADLFVLAGLLAFAPVFFESTTTDSYPRMAGLISPLALAVAYAPTRIEAFLNRLPSADSK